MKKDGNDINKTLLNNNTINKEFQNNNNLKKKEFIHKKKKRKKKLKDYNQIVAIETIYNFCLTGKGQIIFPKKSFNKRYKKKYTYKIENIKNEKTIEKSKSSPKIPNNIENNNFNKRLKKYKTSFNFKVKKSLLLENKYKKITPKAQIHQFKNSIKDLNQKSNFYIIKSNLGNEEKKRIKPRQKIILFEEKTKSSNNDDKKIDISFEEIERRIVQGNTLIQISITPENNKKNIEGEKEKIISKVIEEEKNEEQNKKDDEEQEKSDKIINEDIKKAIPKNKLNKESMLKFLKERKLNYLNFLINQKYEEIQKKNNEIKNENIENEILENQKRFSAFNGVNITSVEDIEYKKNILLYKLKEEIKNKIKDGKCDINELEHFRKFENNLNEYQINYNSKDVNKIKEYFLLISRKFFEFMEEMNYRESQRIEEMRINKFLRELNYELDFNIPRAIWEKGRRCHSSNLYKKIISLSEINKK